jgi:hypothetical protein
MRAALIDDYNRLLPMTAEEFYSVRHALAQVADRLRDVSNGGPFCSADAEEMWLELLAVGCSLETSWERRQPNLRVVK